MTEETKEEGAGPVDGSPTDEETAADPGAESAGDEAGRKGTRGRMGDGIKQGLGVLSAFKEALEETIQEARDRGDLSADRAREVVREALDKAQAAGERAKDKLDFATAAEVESLRDALKALTERVAALEGGVVGPESDGVGDDGPKDAAGEGG